MNKIIKIKFPKRKTPSTLLGLGLDGSRLEGAVVHRSNGSLHVHQRFNVSLSLDPLTNDPELVGREILNHLQAAGVRERHCVVALPLKWTMAAHTELPKLAASDVADFLQIEAERGFPTDISALQVATSRLVSADGAQHATFIGIPRSHIDRLEQVLRAAKLKAISFSLGITALQPAGESGGALAFEIGEHHIGLEITAGGGVAALRALEGAMENAGADERKIPAELIAREARITMGQLPPGLRDSVKRIRIFGPADAAQKLADEIRPRFEPGGLKVEIVTAYPPNEFGKTLPPDTKVSGAFSLAARQLIGRNDPFEFLPPKVSSWERVTSKYAPGKLRKAGAVAALIVLIVIGLFGYQQWQLNSLRSRWNGMSAQVAELQGISDQIAQYRPWFDKSFRCLTILKNVTLAFPQTGELTAKTVEIRDMNAVTCTGDAQNARAVAATIHQLGTIDGVTNFNYQIRGQSPIQFSFDFHLTGGVNETR
ncbi:MAG TPA: hypothetical protein VFM25_05030 [Verrucomicrobiae bacterium]|nr:hypothetical protein [Verrucomicrobiae bacterium]